mmetsp:Transcript_21415/g.36543  ORF Transcript_21415/g.36543 Transcript_21415/m.36543 type:complete len:1761 (+) Transcript_21415:57-5339(+)
MGPFANIKKSRSFSAVQGGGNATLQHNTDADDKTMSSLVNEQTAEDLQETITALRQSIATHANANAETLEHFTTLKKAHDTLYSEHLSLQEQMDDAVELLKYLKEEKCSNETKIKELGTEIGVLKESASGKVGGGVVSLTIENLTREKMELEEALKVTEEDRQEAVNNIEQYELERKEIADKLDEFGLDGTQEEGLTRKVALLYKQASSQKEQIRKLEEQSKQRGNYDAKLQTLLSSMTEEKNRANESITKLQLEKDSLMREQETMRSELKSIQQQEEEICQLNIKLSNSLSTIAQLKRERNNNNTPTEGHNELLLENESLKCKIQDLQDQVEKYSHSAAQKDEIHSQLEREMQERLAKRLAVQLQESKVGMELQIRKELEEEYRSSSHRPPAKSKSKSFHGAEVSSSQSTGQGGGASPPIQLEIEKNLRMQLQQVKKERERWTNEQEEFQAKVLLSQQQLTQVRDGYKKKLDREKARVTELEAAVSDRESVIGKLSDEYRRAMDDLDELQMGQARIKETLVRQHEAEIQELQIEIDSLRNGELGQNDNYNKLKKEMDTLKQKYHNNDEELQTTLSELEQLNIENEECMRKLEAFESSNGSCIMGGMEIEELQAEHDVLCTQHNELKQKYECQKEELDTTLQQLEALNIENEEYLNKNVTFEIAKEAEKRRAEEMQKKLLSLETDNNKLTSDISNSEEERKKLEQLNLETKKLCSETETKLKAAIEETEQSQIVMQDFEAKQIALAEERDRISAELNAEREKLLSLSNQHATVTREKEDHLSTIGALNSEIDELKEAKSVFDGQTKANIDRIQELVDERTKLNTKDSSQIMRIKELEQEKIRLESELSSVADEKDALASAHSQKVEALISERDEVSSACDMKISALTKERDELFEKTADKIELLTKERDELLEKVDAHENVSSEISSSSKSLHEELESLRKMLNQSELAKQELETKLSELHEAKENLANDYEIKLSELSSTNTELKQEKVDLSTKIDYMKQSDIDSRESFDQKIEQLNIELERLKEADTLSPNTTRNESSVNSHAEIDKLTAELNDAQDRCRVLEGGLEDLQLEKEDVEAENEELASKLADLTAQAKTMLVRNEEMENQLDELAMEYDCRVSELERQLCDVQEKLEDKSSCDENEELEALGQKHSKALETITNLKKDFVEAQKKQDEKEAEMKRLKEESLELRQVIDHLQSENDAAREIKYIVLDLKTRNMELTESLRKSRQHKRAAADIIERLKTDNEKLKHYVRELRDSSSRQIVTYTENDSTVENQLVPFAGDEQKIKEMDAELAHYKAIVDKMMSERSIFTQRLSEMMDFAPLKRRHSDCDGQIKLEKDVSVSLSNILREQNGGNVAVLTSIAHPPFASQGAVVASSTGSTQQEHAVQAEIQNLTAENANLAQRLGGAVAEKEFAMTTLSKLGSKMEELVERNKLLESIADLKSSYAIREGSVYSGHSRSVKDKSHGHAPDPDELNGNSQSRKSSCVHEVTNATASVPQSLEPSRQLVDLERHNAEQSTFYDDTNSAFGDSTIVSYEPSVKKLEPEQYVKGYLPADVSVEKRNLNADEGVDGRKERVEVSGNPTSVYSESESTCPPDLKLIKVPGGEYFGQLNSRGQKHGNGKMRYDNGNEYDGQWKSNKRDGKGTTRYASGNVYIGMWKAGKRHGFGVFHISKSGDIYRGNWSGGIKSGPGVYEYADGELDVSFYSNDIRVGDGVRWNTDRSRASRLSDGKLIGTEGDFSVDDAMRLTKKLGFVV